MPFARPSAERHNTVGLATTKPERPLPSRRERAALERLSLDRARANGEATQCRGDALGAITSGKRGRTRPHASEQPALLHRGDPARQSRPPMGLEAEPPGADPQPRLTLRAPPNAVQTQRQSDRRRRVMAAGSQPSRQHRREPAAKPATVSPNHDGPDLRLGSRTSRAAHLPLAAAVTMQHQRPAGWAACGAAAAAAPGPYRLDARNLLRPFLDVDRRIDDPCPALSAHRDRA